MERKKDKTQREMKETRHMQGAYVRYNVYYYYRYLINNKGGAQIICGNCLSRIIGLTLLGCGMH
jgi:hypothetical protein